MDGQPARNVAVKEGQLMWLHSCVPAWCLAPCSTAPGPASPDCHMDCVPQVLPSLSLRNRAGAEQLDGGLCRQTCVEGHLWAQLTGQVEITGVGEATWGAGTPQHKEEGSLDPGLWGQVGRNTEGPVSEVAVSCICGVVVFA